MIEMEFFYSISVVKYFFFKYTFFIDFWYPLKRVYKIFKYFYMYFFLYPYFRV